MNHSQIIFVREKDYWKVPTTPGLGIEVNEKEARCMLKNVKDVMSADEWESFVSSELEGTEYSGDPWEVVGMMIGSAAVCGVDMDF